MCCVCVAVSSNTQLLYQPSGRCSTALDTIFSISVLPPVIAVAAVEEVVVEVVETVIVVVEEDGSGGGKRWRSREVMTNLFSSSSPHPLPVSFATQWKPGRSAFILHLPSNC